MPKKAKREKKHPDYYGLLAFAPNTPEYEKALWVSAKAGYFDPLLSAISKSNMAPTEQRVIADLVTGKSRNPRHRPRRTATELKNLQRALKALDLEATGTKRDFAYDRAAELLECSRETIQKAVTKYEDLLRASDPRLLDEIRSMPPIP